MPGAGEILQGKVIGGKYHLGRYLGGSERSAVFLTERLHGSPRTAAIKLIPADPATADLQLSRWNLISRLTHPHLLQIFEAGRCRQEGEEVLYVVMEYAEENLEQVLSQRSLTPDEANEMLKPTLEVLAYLHGRGFVHGDLKPANIMVASDQLKLASDSILRIGEPEGMETGTNGLPDLPGTAASPARDIWCLGVTLVQVLTQLLPARNGNAQEGVTLPETLPPQFADLARNCLESDPTRRCTLAEIAEHLHYKLPVRTIGPPALPAKPVVVQRPAAAGRPKPAGPAKHRSVWPAVAIILTLVAIVGGRIWSNRESLQPEAPAAVREVPKSSLPAAAASLEQTIPPPPRSEDKSLVPASAPRKAQAVERATLKTASEVRNVPATASLRPRENSTPGALIPGEVIQQVLPDISRGASNTIQGTVRVVARIRVDPAGNVAGVTMVSRGPSSYFAQKASEAARQWRFSPARRDGQAVASVWNVRFEFIRGGARAIPVAAP